MSRSRRSGNAPELVLGAGSEIIESVNSMGGAAVDMGLGMV